MPDQNTGISIAISDVSPLFLKIMGIRLLRSFQWYFMYPSVRQSIPAAFESQKLIYPLPDTPQLRPVGFIREDPLYR